MPKVFLFTMTELTEVKAIVSVRADSKKQAIIMAEAGHFESFEHQGTFGVRGYEVKSFDGVEDES
jgi:hypothetical protein